MTDTTKRAVTLAKVKGASAWLNALPFEEHGFALHKGAFRDALALHYGRYPKGMATTCVCTCGKANDVDHAMSCSCGEPISFMHVCGGQCSSLMASHGIHLNFQAIVY